MSASEERLYILDMIESGKLSAQEGLQLLQELGEETPPDLNDGTSAEGQSLADPTSPQVEEIQEDLERWKRWWVIPFWVGVAVTILSAALMYWAYAGGGLGVWFFLTWIPFLLGLGILVLGWRARTSPWLHLRVEQAPGETPERIALSLPLPIHFTAWLLRQFGHWIPDLDATGLDEVILALGKSTDRGQPLSVIVDEGKNGDRVKILIG